MLRYRTVSHLPLPRIELTRTFIAGVISGIGKGVIASSTGLLLKTIGLKVSSIKIDPYLNVDAGTMSPLGINRNHQVRDDFD